MDPMGIRRHSEGSEISGNQPFDGEKRMQHLTRTVCLVLASAACFGACASDRAHPLESSNGASTGETPDAGSSLGAAGNGNTAGVAADADGSLATAGSSAAAGDSGASGSSAAVGTDDAAGAAGTTAPPTPCKSSAVTPDQVVFIGDSFIAAPTSNIAPDLEMLWQMDGSPGYSTAPRYYQLVGTTMAQIAAQYDSAHSANPNIKVVIGDGGGNDVLVTDRSCLTQAPPANAMCTTTVKNALATADTMITKMEADGVEHLVLFFYPHERTQGLFQGTAPTINESLDYAEPLVRKVCEQHAICTFVSLREAAGDAPGSGFTDRGYINANDVHPSPAGSQFFAGAIWDTMKQHCILTP
jgi:lysophospholipase L1-like esterase